MQSELLPLSAVAERLAAYVDAAAANRRTEERTAPWLRRVINFAPKHPAPTEGELLTLLESVRYYATLLEMPADPSPAPAVATEPPKAPKEKAQKLAKEPVLTAERFWDMRRAALEAICAEYGPRWGVLAPQHDTVMVTVPAKLRSYKTERGTTVRFHKDWRMPAARFWSGGRLPAALAVHPEAPRHDPSIVHDDAWWTAHHCVKVNGEWIDSLEAQYVADLEANRLDRLAAMTEAQETA
jgi:hypothetical protein